MGCPGLADQEACCEAVLYQEDAYVAAAFYRGGSHLVEGHHVLEGTERVDVLAGDRRVLGEDSSRGWWVVS